MIEGKQGKVWATITESPNNPKPHSYETSHPVNINVDHSRSKIYHMMGGPTSAPSESAKTSPSNKQMNQPSHEYGASFNNAEPSGPEVGSASADMNPSMSKMQSPSGVPSIRPIISEAPPSSLQYATANANVMPIPANMNIANEGVSDTGADADNSTLQFLEWQDGSKYYGHVLHGKRHGKGIFVWPDGTRYDGQWFENEMHGKGTLFLLSGNRR